MKIRWWKPWGLIVILMLLMISMGYAEAQETFVREFDLDFSYRNGSLVYEVLTSHS